MIAPRTEIEDVIRQLLRVTPAQRAARLAELPISGDLRRSVGAWLPYLDNAADADTFLDKPVGVERVIRAIRALEEPPGSSPPRSDDHFPKALGRYTVLGLIDEGGMGRVYRAEQQNPRRLVAIKEIRPDLVSAEILQRFHFECSVLASLEHPGIARVIEACAANDGGSPRPYLVMEYVDGVRIDEYCRPRSIADRVRLFAIVCQAVEHAHMKGIIHRDLKPSNILVDGDGRPKILDFGIARAIDRDARAKTLLTVPGQLLGTPRYMSPEQVLGDSSRVDSRSDLYSLGVILFELLSGAHPLLGGQSTSWGNLVKSMASVERPSLGAVLPSCRGDLDAILGKALAKEPAERYEAVSDLRRDLERYLDGRPVEARAGQRVYKVRRLLRRHWALAGSVLTLIVSLAAAVAILWATHIRLSRPASVTLEPDGRTATLRSAVGQPLHVWYGGQDRAISFKRDLPGSPPIVLLVFSTEAESDWRGELVAFSLDDPVTPLWSSADLPYQVPEPTISHPGTPWRILYLQLWDCLPAPGTEIVVVARQGSFSQCCIRVLDQEGNIRYEFWHDGSILGIEWDPLYDRFYVTANSSEKRWIERGHDLGPNEYPAVVFSCTPRAGHIGRDWAASGGTRLDETLLWYRWLGPVEELPSAVTVVPRFLSYRRSETPDATHRGRAQVAFRFTDMPAGQLDGSFHMIIDQEGVELRDLRHYADNYASARKRDELPPFDGFRLLDYEALPAPARD